MTRPAEQHKRGMVDTAEAAHLLGVDLTTIYRHVAAGRLPVKDRMNGSMLFYRADVDRLEVAGKPERPDLCPICRRPYGDDAPVWNATDPNRPPPPPGPRDDELVELIAFPIRFCSDCGDFETRLQAVLAERLTTHDQEVA